jgi:uncharacterized protein (TIGR02145 family)
LSIRSGLPSRVSGGVVIDSRPEKPGLSVAGFYFFYISSELTHQWKFIMKTIFSTITLIASLVLTMIFISSCSSPSNDPDEDNNGGNPTYTYGSITYEGQTYKTVKIGSQTWMAENLNYNASGSKCYDDDPANCNIYGKLYDWATAMVLDVNCNDEICSDQIQPKHRGVCPSGWHIPSNAEWDQLLRYADGTNGTDSPYSSYTAGPKLKSQNSWFQSGFPTGTDDFGFAALPISSNSGYAYWWRSNEDNEELAYYTRIFLNGSDASWSKGSKSDFCSVRCILN